MHINLEQASNLLLAGNVVAIPTETVYGLAAIYSEKQAIEEIYRLKNRPPKNPLIMHVDRAEAILDFIETVPDEFAALAKSFWPGPLTLVLPAKTNKVPEIVRAGLQTQAFRIPSHPVALELLRKTGPLVAPSANLSGRPSSISEAHVESDFGQNFPVLSGGICGRGVESTILAFQGGKWVIGRLGAIPGAAFKEILGYAPAELTAQDALVCPGQLYRHYAPQARLQLVKEFPETGCIIGFSDRKYPGNARVIKWGASDNPEEVLSHLYETLRWLDAEGIQEAFIDTDFPNDGLWRTLSERLQKASKP
jgi:L-threonylcarbamoyladenylate synthase